MHCAAVAATTPITTTSEWSGRKTSGAGTRAHAHAHGRRVLRTRADDRTEEFQALVAAITFTYVVTSLSILLECIYMMAGSTGKRFLHTACSTSHMLNSTVNLLLYLAFSAKMRRMLQLIIRGLCFRSTKTEEKSRRSVNSDTTSGSGRRRDDQSSSTLFLRGPHDKSRGPNGTYQTQIIGK